MTPEVAGMEVGDEVGTSAVALVGSAVGKAVGAEVGTCESLVPLDEPARRQMQKIVQRRIEQAGEVHGSCRIFFSNY